MKRNYIFDIFYFSVVILLLIALFLILYFGFSHKAEKQTAIIDFGLVEVKAELAQTTLEKIKGLSNRNNLEHDTGMLFVYKDYNQPGFCMRDMNFPIDIIWIKDNKIIDFEQNLPLDNCKQVYFPPSEINYVLEVNSGFVAKNSIKVGDKISIVL